MSIVLGTRTGHGPAGVAGGGQWIIVTSPAPAFALPDSRSAKAVPELIAADEEHFARIARALDEARSSLEERLDAARRASGGGQDAMDRDIEVHRLAARQSVLRRFALDLCLGRIVPEGSEEPLYIGRAGLVDSEGRRLLIDWRAPAAEPFFGATHAHSMGCVSRRRYRWANGRVVDFWDEVFAASDRAPGAALDDQSAFIQSLGASRTSQMRDVLGTIQADQDAIIRADSHDALVVDGGPGTGKTVVALHRAAYLLYSDARISDRGGGGVLFIGPNDAYLSYVDDVLPSLGEDSVRIATLRRLTPEGPAALPEDDVRIARLKGAADLERAIQNVVRRYERRPEETTVIQASWTDLDVEPETWAEALDAADHGTPHNEARDLIWDELLDLVTSSVVDMPPHLARRELEHHAQLRDVFDRVWPVLDPARLVAALWTSPRLLATAAPWLSEAEVAALQRRDGTAWTDADLPLVDAARDIIGDPDLARRRRERRAALVAERERIETVVEYLSDADEDGEGVSLMLQAGDMQDRLIDDGAIPTVDVDVLEGPFAHIVIDEAQELSDAEWRMLIRRCPSKSFTIVGDRAQARHGFSASWEERLARVGITRVGVSGLRINYRTPAEVMANAAPEIRGVVVDANVPTSVRESGIPVRRGSVAELDGILRDWLATHGDGVACVIGASDTPDLPRVRALTAAEAKGLEFDLVVLVDPAGLGDGIEGAVDRYVAMTRATEQLVILES
ncbi:RNA polymerase recycling motor ATPase HelR [Microbacterium sp. G2-8]|uniref:RNA polymerase recycling motor ATPase HelR n=1 Tax=Microbacterium sp. G2-8 TaxID=2842454 RepID=UPI001C8A1C24|nr:RNA polymerase recycling motor ATPase HelR [Microbacterium sp. G2-8]